MNGDPIGSEAPRGKSCEKRMGRYDGGFTPSEQRLKNQLMRQFMRSGGEGVGGNTKAYRDGWERTFGPKEPEEPLPNFDLEHEAWMNKMADELIFRRPDKFRSNYDAIDWSK